MNPSGKHPIAPASQPAVYFELTPEEHRIFEFLNRLDNASFEVSDWEAQFINDLIKNPRALTPAQRAKCDQLRTQYEGRL